MFQFARNNVQKQLILLQLHDWTNSRGILGQVESMQYERVETSDVENSQWMEAGRS